MNTFAITSMLPSRAHLASFATVLLLLSMLSAPFAFVAMAAGAPSASNAIDEKPMCYAAGVGCRPGPSMEIALFAPRH
jgi:hypothetical protein